jgi:hypothetical protein
MTTRILLALIAVALLLSAGACNRRECRDSNYDSYRDCDRR